METSGTKNRKNRGRISTVPMGENKKKGPKEMLNIMMDWEKMV